MSKNIFIKMILTIFIIFLVVAATAFGTIKVMDHREKVLLERENASFNNDLKAQIGAENFAELDHVEKK